MFTFAFIGYHLKNFLIKAIKYSNNKEIKKYGKNTCNQFTSVDISSAVGAISVCAITFSIYSSSTLYHDIFIVMTSHVFV